MGGDSAEEALPVLEQLRAENKGVLFVYSVEELPRTTNRDKLSSWSLIDQEPGL